MPENTQYQTKAEKTANVKTSNKALDQKWNNQSSSKKYADDATIKQNKTPISSDIMSKTGALDVANKALLNYSASKGNPYNIKGEVTGGNPLMDIGMVPSMLFKASGGVNKDSVVGRNVMPYAEKAGELMNTQWGDLADKGQRFVNTNYPNGVAGVKNLAQLNSIGNRLGVNRNKQPNQAQQPPSGFSNIPYFLTVGAICSL